MVSAVRTQNSGTVQDDDIVCCRLLPHILPWKCQLPCVADATDDAELSAELRATGMWAG